ncbi:Aste57867_1683 [Aphanomyces stellatus]|uniref:Aste57867_1683 protein n=1 Tax=Aphanomyces stellatus TaxID=120398 RepID=A0A485KB81_9STRA|nr:hypothetical protein As57867_001681 [Aphanomyces stellatus]VFT78894.1 Aste57867_1683 [Aphanomyces stellatus]
MLSKVTDQAAPTTPTGTTHSTKLLPREGKCTPCGAGWTRLAIFFCAFLAGLSSCVCAVSAHHMSSVGDRRGGLYALAVEEGAWRRREACEYDGAAVDNPRGDAEPPAAPRGHPPPRALGTLDEVRGQ